MQRNLFRNFYVNKHYKLLASNEFFLKILSIHNPLQRKYSSNSAKPIDLSHFIFNPDNASSSSPVIIMHGLLGSKQNWRGLGKAIAVKTNRKVYALDARNHGDSPHSEYFDYSVMTADVIHFMKAHNITKAVMIGHSMGGRTAMHLALTNRNLIDKLVIVDVSPFTLPKESSYSLDYMKLMQKALSSISKMSLVQARKSIDDYLAKEIQEVPIRQFLLTNLSEKNMAVVWKPNIQSILKSFDAGVVIFPETSGHYPDEILFICGGDSPYVPFKGVLVSLL